MNLKNTDINFRISHGSETKRAMISLIYDNPHMVLEMIPSGEEAIINIYRQFLEDTPGFMYGPISRDNIEHYLESAHKMKVKFKGMISYSIDNPPFIPEMVAMTEDPLKTEDGDF